MFGKRTFRFAAATTLALLVSGSVAHAQFTGGNLAVRVVGDGSAALGGTATANSLVEYATNGTPTGKTISLSGASQPLTVAGSSTSEGFISLSSDGKYIVTAGYGAAVGTAAIAGTTSTATPRVIGRVDWATGTVDTSTRLSDAFSAGNIRSAASSDGSSFWATGNNNGARFATLGSTTSTLLNSTAPTNLRVAKIFNGQLYVSSQSGAFVGINAVGAGLPNTTGQTVTNLFAQGGSPYDFYINSAGDTVYIADDGGVATTGGLQKWTKSGSTWSLAYTLKGTGTATPLASGLRSVAYGGQAGGNPVFYVTDAAAATNLLTVTDTGVSSVFTKLATAGTNQAFRGVVLLPATGGGPTTPPATPTGLAAVPDDQKVTLTWNSSATATSYTLYRSTAPTSGFVAIPGATNTPTTSFTDTGLTNNTTYYYKVSATNAIGESPLSSAVSATPFLNPPAAPTLTASGSTGLVVLNWNAPAHAVTYNLYRSTSSGTETSYKTGLTKTTFTDIGLTTGTTYYYKVTAVDAAGESPRSNEASATKIQASPFTALSANTANTATDSDVVNAGLYAPTYGISHRPTPNFLNVEGSGQGTGQFNGYIAVRFDLTNIKAQLAENFGGAPYTIQSISLKLQENNAAFTTPGNVLFNLTSDDTTEFGYKYFDANQEVTTDPLGPTDTLPGEELLEIYPFASTGNTSANQYSLDTVPLYGTGVQNPTNASAGADLLAAFSDPANRLTLVGRPQNADIGTILATPTVAATWNGSAFTSGTTQVNQPQLVIVAVPGAVTANVTGTINIEGVTYPHTGGIAIDPITVDFRIPGTTTVVATQTATVNPANGSYSVVAPANGTYDIAFKGAKTLRAVLSSVTLTNGATGKNVSLSSGDADNNNTVDIGDFGILVNAYGSDITIAGSGYNAAADFDDNGVVDIGDFGILVNEYGNAGTP